MLGTYHLNSIENTCIHTRWRLFDLSADLLKLLAQLIKDSLIYSYLNKQLAIFVLIAVRAGLVKPAEIDPSFRTLLCRISEKTASVCFERTINERKERELNAMESQHSGEVVLE